MDSDNQLVPPARESRPRVLDGWAEVTPSKGKGKRSWNSPVEEDKRLQQEDDDIMVIPELGELEEEELTAEVAAPPSVTVNRVATYKELDSDLQKHAGLFTLDGSIDLKLLAKVLSPENEIREDDKVWDWGRLFADVSPDIQQVWTKGGSTGTVESPSSPTNNTPRVL